MEKLRPLCINVDYQVGTTNNNSELFENGKGLERSESSISETQATPVSPATQAWGPEFRENRGVGVASACNLNTDKVETVRLSKLAGQSI